MKKIYNLVLVLLALASVVNAAPRGKIVSEAVTPRIISQYSAQNSITSGLKIVAKGTYAYLSPKNFGDATAITAVTWGLPTKPAGSTATLIPLTNNWVAVQLDQVGDYVVSLNIVTSSGTHDTTLTLTGSNYAGVGNFDGVSGSFPKCMTCHASTPKFATIFTKWSGSNHANIFKNEIVLVGGHYSTSCMPCHTTGYNNKVAADNNGFDDIAASLGWKWSPETTGKWDSIKTYYPNLVNHATIGCENCHGAGYQHATSGDKTKIQISLDAGVCQQCHDAPWRHSIGTQWNYSGHSTAVYETSSTTSGLGACQRCHTAQGFIDFTNGLTTSTTGWNEGSQSHGISCQTCHDPHNGVLRASSDASDTLGNGFKYGAAYGGKGNICMDCHKARRNVDTYVVATGSISSTWGPHHSVQADILLGKNAAKFSSVEFASTNHGDLLADACVDCHMAATTDTGTVTRDQVGGHSWHLNLGDYDHTAGCVSCHGPKTKFSQWTAAMDYDQNGTIESVQAEVKGLLSQIILALPHTNDSTVDRTQLATLPQRKAFWNYQMIANDGSFGMHNTKFTFDVLTKTLAALTGQTPVELMSFNAVVSKNSVNLTWETATETNNKGFDVERKSGKEWVKVAFVAGKGTTTNAQSYSYSDKLGNLSGKISYRLKQVDLDGSSSYSKEVNVSYDGPSVFTLSQNYPNPFNPSTVIKFAVPVESNVKVVVYNVAGQVVKVLANGLQSAGNHEVTFSTKDASVSSGIYFYSIEASAVDGSASFRETKKMILMK